MFESHPTHQTPLGYSVTGSTTVFDTVSSGSNPDTPAKELRIVSATYNNFTSNETKKAILNLQNVDRWTSGEVTALSRQPGWVRIPHGLPKITHSGPEVGHFVWGEDDVGLVGAP